MKYIETYILHFKINMRRKHRKKQRAPKTQKTHTHLSPGVSLIYDLVHDSGMLQSELFTSRNQNLVLAKLPNSGFWRYGQFFK